MMNEVEIAEEALREAEEKLSVAESRLKRAHELWVARNREAVALNMERGAAWTNLQAARQRVVQQAIKAARRGHQEEAA